MLAAASMPASKPPPWNEKLSKTVEEKAYEAAKAAAQFTQIIERLGIEPAAAASLAGVLEDDGRPALLDRLKELGVTKLQDRQALANALGKSIREPVASGDADVETAMNEMLREMWTPVSTLDNQPRLPMNLIRPGLWLGDVKAANAFETQAAEGINYILSLGEKIWPLPKGTSSNYIDAADKSNYDIKQHFRSCSSYITAALEAGGSILVHCALGMSRSAAVVIAHIMLTERMDVVEAIRDVKSRRPQAGPNPGFYSQLRAFGDELGVNRTAWESSAGAGSPSWLAQIQRDAKKAKDKEKAESQLKARGRILNAEKTAYVTL